MGIIPDTNRLMSLPDTLERPDPSAYTNCIRCGLCLAVCPTYRESLVETSSPRGRAQLARKSLDGELPLSENLVEQMYSCFACMACNDICPVGIHPADLALSMRSVQEQVEPAGWKKTLFEGLLPHPGRMEAATFPLRIYQGLGLRRLAASLGILRLFPSQLKDMEGMLPAIPSRPLRPNLPEITPAKGDESYRVGFYLGCVQSLLFAEESAATVRVLARNHCKVYTPRDVVCCGMPARGYGRLDLVRDQAKTNIALFEKLPVDVVVTDCATCGSTLKEYGELLKNDPDWAARAEAFSHKVRDVSEFLAGIPLEKPKGRISARVTYHDPCHLRRAQGVWKQPRQILSMIDGIELVELPEADWCCGSAGTQIITHYETSLKVLNRKMDALAETGAQVIASGCPGCQMQLTTGIKLRDLHVKVVHPIALLDQAYGEA